MAEGGVSVECEEQAHAKGNSAASAQDLGRTAAPPPAGQPATSSAFRARSSDAIARRLAIASAVYSPCLRAFLLPFGAPGDFPPCIRQRPFGIAGDLHRLPPLVRAPHRRLKCMGNSPCMMLLL